MQNEIKGLCHNLVIYGIVTCRRICLQLSAPKLSLELSSP